MRRVSGFAQNIIVAIIALALGAVGLIAYQKFSAKLIPTPSPVTTQSPASDLSSETQMLKDKTANWKTFRGANFEIQYPFDVTVKVDEDGYVWFNKWGPTQKSQTEFYDALNVKIKVQALNGQKLETITKNSETQSSLGPGEVIKALSKIELNGKQGYTYTSRGLGTFEFTFLDYGKHYLEIINFTADPTNLGFKNTVDQILSTFKFLE